MKKSNSQDIFLNAIRKDKISVTVYLNSGIKLQGLIVGFDNFVIILKRDTQIQLIYKHSISTILPSCFVDLCPEVENTDNK